MYFWTDKDIETTWFRMRQFYTWPVPWLVKHSNIVAFVSRRLLPSGGVHEKKRLNSQMPGVSSADKAHGSGHESDRGIAKRSQRQRQHVTIWFENPALADSTARTVHSPCTLCTRHGTLVPSWIRVTGDGRTTTSAPLPRVH